MNNIPIVNDSLGLDLLRIFYHNFFSFLFALKNGWTDRYKAIVNTVCVLCGIISHFLFAYSGS